MSKYEILEDEFITYTGEKLYRIKALKDFSDVKKGDKGGYIEKYINLSQKGNCWVYGNAYVYGNSQVYDNARVYGNAQVCDSARVFGNAKVHDYAQVYDNAYVYGNARVYGRSCVYNYASVYGYAQVYGRSSVYNYASVYGSAYLSHGQINKDIRDDLIQYIACSLNIYPVKGKYILYKRVNKIKDGLYASLYDSSFVYKDGETIRVKYYTRDFTVSCGRGLHVSTPFYWDEGDTLIAVEVSVKDIITCMEGKIRCKKLKVIGEIKDDKTTTD